MISQSRLKELLIYSSETGQFVWAAKRKKHAAGSVAGSFSSKGYWRIKLDSVEYAAHRLAWLYVFGFFPAFELDHINQNKTDNRIGNLREASRAQNQANISHYRTNTTGARGVTWHKSAKAYQAGIKKHGRSFHLGLFKTVAEASEAYIRASKEIHGEFSAQRSPA